TTHVDKPSVIEQAVREVVLDFIAVGLNPTKPNTHFVLQSHVPELTELTAYFSMIVPFSRMEGNPTIKAELAQMNSSPTAGFMIYPISQAADILLFTPYPPQQENHLLVPVGEDQVPHIEEAADIARIFNYKYGNVFQRCEAKVGLVGRLVGTDGQAKMSKSLGNVIQLKDSAEDVVRIVKNMFTDPQKIRKNDPGHPKTCPVYKYHKLFGNRKTFSGRYKSCSTGDLGCVQCKDVLAEVLNKFLEPIRQRRMLAEEEPIGDYLASGTNRAREIGEITIAAVRKAMHLDYQSIFRKGG
ncbi:MAG: tryptophan--tRNA ligase, partial [Patescibacteria group bacterium]|nr:tryptophan--tRNA ligase [Patescibacteria group bacterium]